MPKLKQSILSIVIGLALAAGISYAATWTGPFANPPDDNVPAPLNVGGSAQAKSGNLSVGTSAIPTVSLNVGGASNFTGVSQFLSQAIFVGKIKVGDDTVSPSAGAIRWTGVDFEGYDGTEWKSFTQGMTTPPSKVTQVKTQEFTASGEFTVPSGVENVWVSLIGGGGGGGGGGKVNEDYVYTPGGGGGQSASFLFRKFSVSSEASILVTVGAGGAGGVLYKDGQNGDVSSFGSFVSIAGGVGGKKGHLDAGVGGKIGGQQGKCSGGTCRNKEGIYPTYVRQMGGTGGDLDDKDDYGYGAYTTSRQQFAGGRVQRFFTVLDNVIPATVAYFPGGGGGGGVGVSPSSSLYSKSHASAGAGGQVIVYWCGAGLVPVDGKIKSADDYCQ